MYGVVFLALRAAHVGSFLMFTPVLNLCVLCVLRGVRFFINSSADLAGITFIVLLLCLRSCSRYQDLRKSFRDVLSKWIYYTCSKYCD